ncbi:MAG: N-acetylglucosaminyltransferase [Ferruginibacter sp.]|nr:N-acetylglucosaminyltransferase [Ferruginibacter sp.]
MHLLIIAVSIVFFVSYAVLIIYYRQSWTSIPTFTPAENVNPLTKISVIIPARNEEENIAACLNSILNQTYPAHLFEVLVIDDHSTDNTGAIILQYRDQNVKLVSLKDFIPIGEINSYKKKAIEIAIQQSTGQLIVTTDADCHVPPGWLQNIAACYQQNDAAFIAMPVGYDSTNNFLAIFQALDFMTLQGITGAAVEKKVHSMCNGANLAYEKKAFMEVGGFKGIDNIASGDDMLLMHKIFKVFPKRVFFLKSEEVIVYTTPVNTLKGFFNQRIRWASKADKYEDKRIFGVLLLVYFFNVWILVLGILSIFYPLVGYFIAVLTAKTIIELLFLYPVARFFNQRKLLWWFPLAQPFHVVYTVIAGWLGKFGKYTWKERTVK